LLILLARLNSRLRRDDSTGFNLPNMSSVKQRPCDHP
jgi:hypothetical protein